VEIHKIKQTVGRGWFL